MKLFRMIRFGIRDAFKSVHRNFSLSIASISCISITLLVVSLALLASFNVKNISHKIEEDVTMVVFLKLGANDDVVQNFKNKLSGMDNVLPDWDEITPEERKEEIVNSDDKLAPIVASVDNVNEVFHHSFILKVKDITKIKDTVKEIEKSEDVYSVNYGETTVTQMLSIFDMVEKIAFAIVLILLFVTAFLIVNTIKLTIFSRKREISIMRVVGASNWTIKNPFIIEGFIIGLIGSIIPIIITIYGYTTFHSSVNGYILSPLMELINPQPFVYFISAILVVIGVIIGMLGSGRAVRKYLKV